MFKAFCRLLIEGKPIRRIPQGSGKSATKKEFLATMEIYLDDSPEQIERKVRAFWYLPHKEAFVMLGGKRFTLVNDNTLSLLGRFLHGSRREPF